MCRTDLTSSGSSILNSCVLGGCSSNTNDVNSAESIYAGYCASVNGAPAATAATTTKPSNDQVGVNGGTSKTVTITATVITSNGAVTTSPIAPLTTVVNQNDPNYNNVIEIGSGNTQKGGTSSLEFPIM